MLVWLFHLVHELVVLLSEGIEVCSTLLLVSVPFGLVHAVVRILIHLVIARDIFRCAFLDCARVFSMAFPRYVNYETNMQFKVKFPNLVSLSCLLMEK